MAQPKAFTLLELMIIIGILAILAAVVLPSITAATHKVSAATIATNTRTLADACRVAFEQDGTWPTWDSEDGLPMPASLDNRLSEATWSDILQSWGYDTFAIESPVGGGIRLSIEGQGDYIDTLNELERLVDDGDATTGTLLWTADGTQWQVLWTLSQ
ncbi:MAG: prepilin-type N-terminal cleavage/methylation domain-containing protein [Planctomycetota bacterium]